MNPNIILYQTVEKRRRQVSEMFNQFLALLDNIMIAIAGDIEKDLQTQRKEQPNDNSQ
jgi:hypothetical protein